MKAEEFFRTRKSGRRIENEYFIAMDKDSFFKMMEAYAFFKNKELTINTAIKEAANRKIANLKHN